MNIINADIQQSIDELPDNIRNAVINFDWAKEILEIAREHNIQIDEADIFRQQTLLVILGKVSADNYEQNLVNEMKIHTSVAHALVNEANQRIFVELQKHAFGKGEEVVQQTDNNNEGYQNSTPITTRDTSSYDSYLEPIDDEGVKDIFKQEGIELISHEPETTIHDADLYNEVSEILTQAENNSGPRENEPIADPGTTETPSENHTNNLENQADIPSELKNKKNNYQEPIENSDLKGVKNNPIDTSILRTKYQTNPENALSEKSLEQKPLGRDLGQGNPALPELDKHIMENPFIATTDTRDVSPSRGEQAREEGGFLEHLTTGK